MRAVQLAVQLCVPVSAFGALGLLAVLPGSHSDVRRCAIPRRGSSLRAALLCSRIIVDCEVNTGAWTLMHRFNKATDLLGDVMAVGGGRIVGTTACLAC